ncbi:MAG: tetratricopeptide repeat protein [Acidobacteriota bacterium]|nr:tetratricopeptide repeat protein [Acidobacteriota bacterium]
MHHRNLQPSTRALALPALSRQVALQLLRGMLILLFALPAAAGTWQEGVEAYKSGHLEEAARLFQIQTETHPDYAPAHFLLGSSLRRLQRPQEAVGSLERALELSAAQDSAAVPVDYRLELGMALAAAGQPDRSFEVLSALRLSQVPEARRKAYGQTLGVAAVGSGRTAELRPALEKLVADDGGHSELWLALAQAREQGGAAAAAFDAYARALELAPKPSTLQLTLRAAQLAEQQLPNEAEAARSQRYRRVAELAAAVKGDPKAVLLAGDAALRGGALEQARASYQQAAKAGGGEALYGLARTSVAQGEPERALEELAKAQAVQPSPELASRIQRTRGQALHALGRYTEAAAAYTSSGDPEKAAEMERFAELAEGNEEFDRKVAECRQRQREVDELRAEQSPLLPEGELEGLEAQLSAMMADCRPYLDAAVAAR